MTWAAFRTGRKTHLRRPPARERSARRAWDRLAVSGEIISMKLIDGLWLCERPSGELDVIEAPTVLHD